MERLRKRTPDLFRDWQAFLTEMGIKWTCHTIVRVDLGTTYNEITPTALLYAPYCPWSILGLYLENKDPGCYIGVWTPKELVSKFKGLWRKEKDRMKKRKFMLTHDWELSPPFENETQDLGREVLGAHYMYRRKEKWIEGDLAKKEGKHDLDDGISIKNSSR